MEENFITYATDILGDTATGLKGSEIDGCFAEYSMKFKRKISSEDRPFMSKRDKLKLNLQSFKDNEKYYIINDLCSKPNFLFKPKVKELQVRLIKNYPELSDIQSDEDKLDTEIINQTQHWLQDYPKALKLYNQAIENYKIKAFERNILDDLRLALELLLKQVFTNEKSLENQLPNIGALVSKAGGSKEYTNMFIQLIKYYGDYQNSYVKHNDKVVLPEVEFTIEITSIFMKNIIKFNKNIS